MRLIWLLIYNIENIVQKGIYKVFRENAIKASLGSCGKNVGIGRGSDFMGNANIFIGNNSVIGVKSILWSTRAKIIIESKVVMGPQVSIITGNHRTDRIGKYIIDVKDDEKREIDDADVIICKDSWIASNVTILKGCVIAEGCIIAAGSIVTESTDPYGIYAGVPAKRIKERFTEVELQRHITLLHSKKEMD